MSDGEWCEMVLSPDCPFQNLTKGFSMTYHLHKSDGKFSKVLSAIFKYGKATIKPIFSQFPD